MAKAEHKEPRDEGARSFALALQQMDGGAFHSELSEEQQKVLSELHAYAVRFGVKARGTLTITLNFEVSENCSVGVVGDVKTKLPKARRAGSLFFLTKGNNLSPNNPRQQELALRDVNVRDVHARDPLADDQPARSL